MATAQVWACRAPNPVSYIADPRPNPQISSTFGRFGPVARADSRRFSCICQLSLESMVYTLFMHFSPYLGAWTGVGGFLNDFGRNWLID